MFVEVELDDNSGGVEDIGIDVVVLECVGASEDITGCITVTWGKVESVCIPEEERGGGSSCQFCSAVVKSVVRASNRSSRTR